MANRQPRSDAELRDHAEQAAVAMAALDTLPRPLRLLIHEFGVLPVQEAARSYGFDAARIRTALIARQARMQADRLTS